MSFLAEKPLWLPISLGRKSKVLHRLLCLQNQSPLGLAISNHTCLWLVCSPWLLPEMLSLLGSLFFVQGLTPLFHLLRDCLWPPGLEQPGRRALRSGHRSVLVPLPRFLCFPQDPSMSHCSGPNTPSSPSTTWLHSSEVCMCQMFSQCLLFPPASSSRKIIFLCVLSLQDPE